MRSLLLGSDIYEFTANDYAVLNEVITSNPHYQLPERNYEFNTLDIHPDKDVIRKEDGTLVMVYIARPQGAQFFNNLYFMQSTDNGESWSAMNSIYYGDALYGVQQPSLAEGSDGNLWVSFISRNYNTVTFGETSYHYYDYGIIVSRMVSGTWSTPEVINTPTTPITTPVTDTTPNFAERVSPRLFQIADGTGDSMGLVYYDMYLEELHFIRIS